MDHALGYSRAGSTGFLSNWSFGCRWPPAALRNRRGVGYEMTYGQYTEGDGGAGHPYQTPSPAHLSM